jgi:hypothetical protein
MEGFLDIRLPGWARRLITRSIAIVPAAIVTIWYGAKGTAELLILSQVILSLQLPFAIVPLVMFTADRRKMGELVAPRWVTVLAAITAAVIIALNVKLLYDLAFPASRSRTILSSTDPRRARWRSFPGELSHKHCRLSAIKDTAGGEAIGPAGVSLTGSALVIFV